MALCFQIRSLALPIALLSLCGLAAADTIVLKNGRRIAAVNVVEEGEKVKYLTSAGELSLPKSIVDHIEKGPAAVAMAGAAASSATSLAIAPPTTQPRTVTISGEIERAVVHDGSVDRGYIGKLEVDAQSGSQQANFNAAIGHHAAATFELSHGDLERALSDERTALTYAPEEPALMMNAAYIHLRRSEYQQALEYLDRAKRRIPDDPDVAKLSGWSYYGLNKLDQAVAEWKRAIALRPDPDVQQALAQALRDKQEEENYHKNESTHFQLRYSGAAAPGLARDVLRTLEMHFSAIESELNYTPPEAIGVILYTQEAFTDITRAPSWVGALYDGRIRVPVQGLSAMDQELSRTLKHELTHCFIAQKTKSACLALAASCTIRAPTWIQEGVAQWMEGHRSGENAASLVLMYGQGRATSLSELEGDWTKMDADKARLAYAWALANIEYIVEAGGMGDIERILDRIGAGMATEAALREVLHSDYDDLMKSTAEYLRKNYVR